jgi:hypothetical protein
VQELARVACLNNTRELHNETITNMTLTRHTFIAGNLVRFSKRYPPRKAAPGPYKVVAQLPERDGQFQYRIKSGYEPFYRTVMENELEADTGVTVRRRHLPF